MAEAERDALYYRAMLLFVETEYALFTPPIDAFEALLKILRAHVPPQVDPGWIEAKQAVHGGDINWDAHKIIKTRTLPKQHTTGVFTPVIDRGVHSPAVTAGPDTSWMAPDHFHYAVMMKYLEAFYIRYPKACEDLEYFFELMDAHHTKNGMPFTSDPAYWQIWQESVENSRA